MRKYGSPEPLSRVPNEGEPEPQDPQGINVTSTRHDAEIIEIPTVEIIYEGEDRE